MGDPIPVCPPCITVVPNSFLDGESGREIKVGYNGEPRIKCVSGGEFQVHQDVFGGCPGGCRPVGANGFLLAIKPAPPVGEEVLTKLLAGSGWPPSWWPTKANQPSEFQPGVPTVPPPWAEEPDDGSGDEEAGLTISGTIQSLGEQSDAPRPPTPRRRAPRKK